MSDPETGFILGLDWELIGSLGAILVLLLFSGFFSGSETALTAASRARIHHLAQQGNAKARRVDRLIGDKESLIGAILIGNNLVNILASALATSLFLKLFGDAGVAYATLLMTALVVVFAEVLPKTYAIAHPERGALGVARLIGIVVALLGPVVRGIQVIVRGTLRLFGEDITNAPVLSAMEEIRGQIDLHHREGQVRKSYRDMLGSILDLRTVDVAEVMVHRKNIFMIDANTPADEIVRLVMDSRFTRIPLYEDDPENVVGVLHAKDVLRAMVEGKLDKKSLLDIAQTPWFVPESTDLHEQLEAFKSRHAHFALVVDEYGAIRGLVTLEDILEEIVGEITDEHDEAVAGVRPQSNGTYVVDGWVTLRDLNREFDWDLPDEEATTLAGLVMHEAQTIPEPGQAFSFHGCKFEILRRQRNQLTAIRVTPPLPRAERA